MKNILTKKKYQANYGEFFVRVYIEYIRNGFAFVYRDYKVKKVADSPEAPECRRAGRSLLTEATVRDMALPTSTSTLVSPSCKENLFSDFILFLLTNFQNRTNLFK